MPANRAGFIGQFRLAEMVGRGGVVMTVEDLIKFEGNLARLNRSIAVKETFGNLPASNAGAIGGAMIVAAAIMCLVDALDHLTDHIPGGQR
jgi:hypothetical protein